MKDTISILMLRTLKRATLSLGDEATDLIRSFVEDRMTDEGVFVDRSGKADIYYTSFGLLLSHVLGIKRNYTATEQWLNSIDSSTLDMVHYAAYVRSRMLNRLQQSKAKFLLSSISKEPIREAESFAAVPNNDLRSPYAQFILYSLCEDTGNATPASDLAPYHCADGGYANARDGEPSVNATAAALMVQGQNGRYNSSTDVEWLRSEQLTSGGFRAERNTPLPDLLSTATALFTLRCYGVEPRYSAAEFIEAHWLDDGGFAATLMDEESDVEYLFYGLLALGTL